MDSLAQAIPVDQLTRFVTLLIALSVAAERLVEIVKGSIRWLQNPLDEPKQEGRRRAVLQLLAVGSGFATAWLAGAEEIVGEFIRTDSRLTAAVIVGLLASGGSGFWNSILGYLSGVKKLKESEAKTAVGAARAAAGG